MDNNSLASLTSRPARQVRLPAEDAVFRALLYSDIFDFPLTLQEISRFAETKIPLSQDAIKTALPKLEASISEANGFYFIKGNGQSVTKRQNKQRIQIELVAKAGKICRLLSCVPTVSFIGISGALGAGNSTARDDIDLFVITSDHALWTTRFLLLGLLQLLGLRRKRVGRYHEETICLNMLLEEKAMHFEEDRQDVYTARECVQMLPVFSRQGTYGRFIAENSWIRKYLAGGYEYLQQEVREVTRREKEQLLAPFFVRLLRISGVEYLFYRLEYAYMLRHRTDETVKKQFLALHPRDYRREVMQKYEAKLRATGY